MGSFDRNINYSNNHYFYSLSCCSLCFFFLFLARSLCSFILFKKKKKLQQKKFSIKLNVYRFELRMPKCVFWPVQTTTSISLSHLITLKVWVVVFSLQLLNKLFFSLPFSFTCFFIVCGCAFFTL
jgi:hypothetical protein